MKNKINALATLVLLVSFIQKPQEAYGGTWLIGGGVEYLPQPIVGFDDDYNPVPLILYIGKYFRILGDTFQFSVAGNPTLSMDITGTIRRMGYEIPGRERRKAFDMGVGWLYNRKPHRARVEIIGDVTSSHNGYAVNSYWLTEFKFDKWQVNPRVELMWESDKIAQYYYGNNVYQGQSGWYPLLGVEVNYSFNKKWSLTTEFNVKGLSNVKDSPLVDTDHQWYAFAGVLYVF